MLENLIQSGRSLGLSPREAEACGYVALGCDNATIAASMRIAETTLSVTLRAAFVKMGEHGGSARVRVALRLHGIKVGA